MSDLRVRDRDWGGVSAMVGQGPPYTRIRCGSGGNALNAWYGVFAKCCDWGGVQATVGQGTPYACLRASRPGTEGQVRSRQPVFVVPAKAGTQSACDRGTPLASGCAKAQPAFEEGDRSDSQAFCSPVVRRRGLEGRA